MDDIQILVVDDSRIFRGIMERALADIAGARVVGSVFSGDKALEFLATHQVDLVTLDVAMPGKDGLATLSEIQRLHAQRKRSVSVVMVSALTKAGAPETVEALAQGAFDFLEKPVTASADESLEVLRRGLRRVITAWRAGRGEVPRPQAPTTPIRRRPPPASETIDVVAIGCSTGGPKALRDLLPGLCQRCRLPVLIVQHMPPSFTASLAENLDRRCAATVVEAADGMPIEAEHVYIAPGGHHLVVRRTAGRLLCGTNQQEPENGCRPAADVLFRSCAAAFGAKVLGLILTGMGEDGTRGLKVVKRAGGRVLAQDRASSVVWGMPGAAVHAGVVDRVLPLLGMAEAVGVWCGGGRS